MSWFNRLKCRISCSYTDKKINNMLPQAAKKMVGMGYGDFCHVTAHSFRRRGITRSSQCMIPDSVTMAISQHQSHKQFSKYVQNNNDLLRSVTSKHVAPRVHCFENGQAACRTFVLSPHRTLEPC